MDGTKKISFGFNKLNRKPNILMNKEPAKQEISKVQLIEYLEEQSIKVIGDENNTPVGPLIIPMKAPNKKLINLIDIVKNDFKDTIDDSRDKTADYVDNKDEKSLTLDELAAKELINGTSNNNAKNDVTKVIEVPGTNKLTFDGEKESSLDDYESIPVDQFGRAMLRGMGWKDGEDTPAAVDRNGKALTCVKGAYIKVIAGYHKGSYGQIMGFDDESGRFIIKLALANINVSLNEFLVTPVTKEDYNKNSKVLNNAKYEEYKELKENAKQRAEKQVKTEPEDSSVQDSKVRIKKELNHSSSDEQTSAKQDYTKVEVKKEKVKDKSARKHTQRSHSSEEYTRKHRESKHKSKEQDKSNHSRDRNTKKHDTKRYSDTEDEAEEAGRTNKYESDEEYTTNRSTKRSAVKKKANRRDKSDSEDETKQERRPRSNRSDSEEKNKVKKRNSEETNSRYERKTGKHSRNRRYDNSDSENEDRKTHKKDKYRDRSKHSRKDKRK
ncbi:uncharacterized protein CBL_09790 [Carabus blaptoides fortunei]